MCSRMRVLLEKAMKKKKLRDNITGYGFILPSLILLAVFVIMPILMTFYFSLSKYTGLQGPFFIGVQNFLEAFKDLGVRAALKNTLVFVIASVPLQVVLSLWIAALLAAHFRNRFGELVRGALFIPVLCSSTLVGIIFAYLFASDAGSFANMIANLFGAEKINWLGSEKTALGVIIFVNTWKSVGYYLVIFYAGIMDIPTELYEASEVDGASKKQQFFYVTLPNLRNVLFMVITVCTIWSFQIFDLAYVMTAGGPGYATTSLVYQMYTQGFRGFNFGYASAIAVLLFCVVLIMNIIQRTLMKEAD